jgi:hypothetical protein
MPALVAGITIGSGTVLVLIPLIVLPIAAVAFASSGGAWRQIGRGRFAIEQELPPSRSAPPNPGAERAVQAAEARQMLEAKSYRRVQRGEPALDVEAELKSVLDDGPAGQVAEDAELRAEVRRLVIVRNERRAREGQAPLDVEAETERQLADFIGSSC